MRVLLPAPFSPSSAWISPGCTSKLIRSLATTPGNRFVMSRSWMTAPVAMDTLLLALHELLGLGQFRVELLQRQRAVENRLFGRLERFHGGTGDLPFPGRVELG